MLLGSSGFEVIKCSESELNIAAILIGLYNKIKIKKQPYISTIYII